MLLGVPIVDASAIPQIDGDELLSLGHVDLGPESWTYEDVYNRALVTLVGYLGDRDDWPPPHPSDPSMQGKTPTHPGNDGAKLWKAIEALGLDELQYDLLVHEARGLVKRRDFRQLEVGVTYLLEQGHAVGPELLEQVRDITRQETKTAPASTKTGGDAGWFAAIADMRHADRDRIATGAFDCTIKRWQESGNAIPLSWRETRASPTPSARCTPPRSATRQVSGRCSRAASTWTASIAPRPATPGPRSRPTPWRWSWTTWCSRATSTTTPGRSNSSTSPGSRSPQRPGPAN